MSAPSLANPPEDPSEGNAPVAAPGGSPRPEAPGSGGGAPGRAQAFRRSQEKQRSTRNERIGVLVVIVILLLGVVTILTARPYFPGSTHQYPTPGPPIVVALGSPVVGSVACAAGGSAYTERVAWINATKPVATGDVNVKVYEIFDGDFVGDPGAVANATASDVCAGAPPTSTSLWYIVLSAPNGTNVLTYTVDRGWLNLTGGTGSGTILDGSFLTLVTSISLAGTGRGLAVVGSAGGSPITGSTVL